MKAHRLLALLTAFLLVGMIWVLAEHVYSAYRIVPDQAIIVASSPPAIIDSGLLPAESSLALPTIEDLHAVIDRPIFSQSRRPVEIAEEVPEPLPAPELEVDLVGVVISRVERFAFVRSRQDNSIIKINEGANVAGWVAIGIGPEYVLFRQGDREQELRLSYKGSEGNG
jgi:hypothetical protein